MSSLLILLMCIAQAMSSEHVIQSRRSTNWGPWHAWSYCPNGTYAVAMRLKTEIRQNDGDDTALNGIELQCADQDDKIVRAISSGVQKWGEWGNRFRCETGIMNGFSMLSEASCGDCDDTAANNVKMLCTNGKLIEGDGQLWGQWSPPVSCARGYAVCGLRTQIEAEQGKDDDTALNNVDMKCCKIINLCSPNDTFGAPQVFDNRGATTGTLFTYQFQEGVSVNGQITTGWTQSETQDTSSTTTTEVSFLDDLSRKFSEQVGHSLTTGYDWRKSEGSTWNKLHKISIAIDVPAGKKVTVDQIVGRCGKDIVFTRHYRRVDSS